MTVIYSKEHIGINGSYIDPRYFDGKVNGTDLVYTDDDKIKKAYNGIEVKPITIKAEKKTTKKKTTQE